MTYSNTLHGYWFLGITVALLVVNHFIPVGGAYTNLICLFLILTIGISHGSLDNLKGNKILKLYKIKNQVVFYLVYIVIALLLTILWLLVPSFTLVIFLIIGPWKREGIASTGGTDIFDKASWVPTIGNSNFPLFLLVVILLLYLISALVIKYSSLGIRLKATGINIFATERFYFTSDKYIIFSYLIAGGIAGIAGFSQSSAAYHKLVPSISGGFGFLSILIVLICSRNIYFSFIVSFLFAALIVGGSQLQIRMGLDHSIIGIIQATFVLSWLVLQKLELEKLISQKITKVFVK